MKLARERKRESFILETREREREREGETERERERFLNFSFNWIVNERGRGIKRNVDRNPKVVSTMLV